VNSGWKQRKHLRTSKTGKVFNAGSKVISGEKYYYRNVKFKGPENVDGEEWNNISGWTRFSGYIPLMVIRKAFKTTKAALDIWQYQNGMPGVSAIECEFDWSAIRDSTDDAIDVMFEVAKKYVNFNSFMSQLKDAENKDPYNGQDPGKKLELTFTKKW